LAADTAPLGKLFRGYDIRGIVGQDLDDATSRSIGQAVGSLADGQGYTWLWPDGVVTFAAPEANDWVLWLSVVRDARGGREPQTQPGR
jgi:hypothetical protein